MTSVDALSGVGCSAGSTSGSLSVDYDAAHHVVLTCVAAPVGTAMVRINEFAVGTTGSLGDEFVEVVNAGTAAADIGGYRLVYRSAAGTSDVALATVPAGTTLAAGGFYLFGGGSYAGAVAADQSFSTGLASTGGGIALRDAGGAIVDSVGYGTATNAFVEGAVAPAPPITTPPGSSAGRSPDGHDTNNNAADFGVSSSPTPRTNNH